MAIITDIVNLFFSKRLKEIDNFRENPARVQQQQLNYLLQIGRRTQFGKQRGLERVKTVEEFQQAVEISDYEGFHDYIARQKSGEKDVVWPTEVKWYAKSSGTTDANSKYIPVTDQGLKNSHMKGPRDVIAIYAHNNPKSKIFHGKTLTLGGSKKIEREGERAMSGDLSAILIENTPSWAAVRKSPPTEVALIADFDEKVRRIAEVAVKQDIRSFAGVPSWNLVMMNKILEITGKNNLLEIWPDMELFIHGGMNFKPYREEYRRIIPSPDMRYMETYNASEGFFGIADDPAKDDMLLMLDYQTFYEFLPLNEISNHSKAIPLEGVKMGVNYAMILTSSNGLWRYMIGDTVEFTSISPYRIKITGRTKHYVNAFGEEVVIDNAETALREACDATGAEVVEFSVAPVYMEGKSKGAHEWVVEFRTLPDSLDKFREALDKALQRVNSDYEAKRFKDTTLAEPRISVVPAGTFIKWMTDRGKAGGQNKVPRLFNDRTFVDELLATATSMSK